MCTVSWLQDDRGYQLLCNRDEKKTRCLAHPPRIESSGGVRFVGPRDGDFGGTWIATNEFGLTFCLLNRAGPTGLRSRGLTVLDLVSEKSLPQAQNRLAEMDLRCTSSFTLVMLAPQQHTTIAEWSGQEIVFLPNSEACMPLTSSSFEAEAVCAARRREFEHRAKSAGRLDPAVLFEFHQSHGDCPSAYSTCMHRPDAETVSFSWIKVSNTAVEFFYKPAAPCQSHSGETHQLARQP